LRTLVPIADWARENLAKVIEEANALLGTVRVGKTAAERPDYQIAKRCVEQASMKLWSAGRRSTETRSAVASRLLERDFVKLGLDLKEDEYEKDSIGDEKPQWEVSERMAGMVLGTGGSLWELFSAPLDELEVDLRVRVVEQLARYLTYKEVPFLGPLGLSRNHLLGDLGSRKRQRPCHRTRPLHR
jgi:hypothetical protein